MGCRAAPAKSINGKCPPFGHSCVTYEKIDNLDSAKREKTWIRFPKPHGYSLLSLHVARYVYPRPSNISAGSGVIILGGVIIRI